MNKTATRLAALAFGLLPLSAAAEPITLKLAFWTSDRSIIYQATVKPFVDAVNEAAPELVRIKVYFSGKLNPAIAEQPQLIEDGKADIAFVIPGMTRELFPDNAIIEAPGLFRSTREATLIYTRLAAAHALRGYDPFVVIGAYGTEPESFHLRKPIKSIEDLRGLKIRTNNEMEAEAVTRLGAKPVVLAINKTTEAIADGSIDGALVPPPMLFDAGIGRVASTHYLLRTSTAPLALLMSRKTFDALPPAAQAIIAKYSGEWVATRFIEIFSAASNQVIERLQADHRRHVVIPSPSDMATAHAAFAGVVDDLVKASPHNRELLAMVQADLAKIRAAP